MDFVYFVLLVSCLIFIHELGHFTMAKLFGVRVVTFSLGFGPTLLRLRGAETEYRVALFPLGGFVKMLEETGATTEILPEDRPRTFEAQARWKRAAIVLAGPAMNLVFPVLLYTWVFLGDRMFLAPTIGVVLPDKPAYGLLAPGDRISAIDGRDVATFHDVQRRVAESAGLPLRLTLQRGGRTLDVTVTPALEDEPRGLDIVDKVGRIGVSPSFPAPVIGVPRTDSPAYRAGLRTFDRVLSVQGRRVDRMVDLVAILAANRGDTVVVTYLRPVDAPGALGGLVGMAVMEPGVATLTPTPPVEGSRDEAGSELDAGADVLARTGIESADMYVSFVPEGSSEWRAGLRVGDRILTLDGAPQRLWQSMKDDLVRGASRVRQLAWTRAGQPMGGSFQLRKEQWDDELGQHYERYVFRTTHWLPNAKDELVENPHPIVWAVRRGFEETASVVRFIAVGLVRVLQGRVSLTAVSGPITIYDIAGQAGAKGTTYFVWAMAVVSVNLGLVNLLPIPLLDGGHFFFLALETLARRPVSIRVREIASLVGVTVLAALMLLAFKNDVTRHWDVIVERTRGLFG
jgi:regulator of sigma E protease